MIYTILAIGIFFLTIIMHECVHYLVAKRFGRYARFKWVSAKEKHTIGIFGWLPGVRTEFEGLNERKWISLSPIPFEFIGFLCFFIVLFWDYWGNVEWNFKAYFMLFISILFAAIVSIVASYSDIKGYKNYKKTFQKGVM